MTPQQLADRVEAATGADRELDALIAFAIGCRMSNGLWFSPNECKLARNEGRPLSTRGNSIPLLHFTASIDAALTLVPEGWRLYTVDASIINRARVTLEGPKTEWVVNEDGDREAGEDWYKVSVAPTMAPAITAAALRARALPTTTKD